jgi:tetratricopeptide (TPR) repeat protein
VTNIFALEDSIAKQVAKAVTARLSGNERRLLEKRDTDNPQAYQAYLKGRYFYINRSKGSYKDSVQKAIQYFNQAIILDPKYALAYAGLADCYGVLHLHGIMSPQEAWPMAEKAAFTALQHDGELAEAHLSLGHLRTAQWDFAAAEKEYAKAIELKPNWGRLHSQYARYLAVLGRFDDALAENAKALEIDPLSVNVRSSRGGTLWLARRYDEAIQQLCTTLELDPRFGVAHFYLGLSYGSKKMYDEALLHLNKAETLLGKGPELLASLGRIHALAGRVREARETINELKGLSEENYVEPYFIALIYAALGETEAAFDWLEKAYSEHDEDLALIGVDPRVDSLRADPRFVSLLDRIGLSNTANRQTLKQPRAVGLVKKPVNERGSPL